MILKRCKIRWLDYSCLLRGLCKLAIKYRHPRAKDEALLIFGQSGQFISKLLSARLYCEIGLTKCHYWFRWIGILDNEVTGIAREVIILSFPFSALTILDHFNL